MGTSPLRVNARLSFVEGSDVHRVLRRGQRDSDKPAFVLKRIVLRYNQILENSVPPNPNMVLKVGDLLIRNGVDLLFQEKYPTKVQVHNVISKAPIPKEDRDRLNQRIDAMSFADFGKLIEAIENYYNGK